jgi:hypothetical protein
MNKDSFKFIVKKYYEITYYIYDLYFIGFDITDNKKFPINNLVYDMFIETMKSQYNEEGLEWISWYIYEYSPPDELNFEKWMYPDKEPGAWDVDGTPICYNIDSLYDYINEHCKLVNK